MPVYQHVGIIQYIYLSLIFVAFHCFVVFSEKNQKPKIVFALGSPIGKVGPKATILGSILPSELSCKTVV